MTPAHPTQVNPTRFFNSAETLTPPLFLSIILSLSLSFSFSRQLVSIDRAIDRSLDVLSAASRDEVRRRRGGTATTWDDDDDVNMHARYKTIIKKQLKNSLFMACLFLIYCTKKR